MANARLNATITIGGAISGSLRSALGTTRDRLQEIGSTVRNLERQQRTLGNSIQTFGRMGRNVDGLRTSYAAVTAEIERARRAQERLTAATHGMATGRSRMASAGVTLGATAVAASTAFVPVIQAAAFEKAMLGVAKQVDGARDKSGQLTQVYFDMAKQVQYLGRELPMATNDIADMVAAGARMGVAKDELIGFTRTAGMMSSAFELPAAELADQMGKIAKVYNIPIPKIGELADVINYLDDNAISKGGDIIDVMQRIGGTAAFLKMPTREAAALASTFLTLGSSAEIAATASNAVMRELSIATMQPKRFQAGLKAIGMDAKKVQSDMSKDATGTIQKVLDALNKLPEEKRLTIATELFGKEYGDDIAKLANGVEEYRRQLALASSDKAMGSMLREHQARLQTTTAQWEIAKNRITEVGVNIGSVLLPAANEVLGVFGSGTSAVADFVRENETLVSNIAVVVGAVAGSVSAWNALKFGIGAVTWGFNALKLAMATNPFGLIAIGVVTAAALIYKNWEPIKTFFVGVWNSIKETSGSVWPSIKQAFLDYTPLGLVIQNWGPIGTFFTGLFDNIKATVGSAIDWVIGKIQTVSEFWNTTKTDLGFRSEQKAAVIGVALQDKAPAPSTRAGVIETTSQSAQKIPALPQLPEIPPMATAKASSGVVNAQQTNTFNITQQPGQDAKQLADEVMRQLKARQGVASRGTLFDKAQGY